MVYKSKIGLELSIPLVVVFGGSSVLMVLGDAWPGLLVMLPPLAFIVHMFFTTYYTIDGNILKVNCGFTKQTVDIKTIRKISDDMNWISAPALSLDRLELFFSTYDSVVVSPKDKIGFVKELLTIKPDIELNLKKINLNT
ncbi:hypothetical protein FMM05_09205 [Flavobacterium zepuense]|uniref:Uncharacterized protein YyaB-like PH domain-containing protein n=1 Tax=Flavobacterium zepuense TaxID=2593302 RepID=A0A552V2J9_9FLAO|nr:PH domain-containing protein [Flavobacterium zepuense]TRW24677.1 hypothetical protein FMM05_09205 [Flavobacterium zepuense]